MKVLETEKVVLLLQKLRKFMGFMDGGAAKGPAKYLTEESFNAIIERLEKESVDFPERIIIRPNDTVLHRPSGETWVVCGVNYDQGRLIPSGYPFPSMACIEDCELIERGYEKEPQTVEQIAALRRHGLESYIDVESAKLHGIN